VLVWGDGSVGELLEAIDQRSPETAEAIAVSRDRRVLAVIEVFTNLLRRVDAMIEVGDESRNGALEVNIVLP